MFAELPKLLDRDFAVGYFLPVATFLGLNVAVLKALGFLSGLLSLAGIDLLIGTTLIGLLSWLGGIILLAVNRSLIRLLEGYGRFNPLRLLSWIEHRRYSSLHDEIAVLDKEYRRYRTSSQDPPRKLVLKRNRLLREAVENFPDNAQWLLPTPFGNTIRAFEVYPRVMYGVEATTVWDRLLGVISKEHKVLVDGAKTSTDFWLNLGVLCAVTTVEVIAGAIALRRPELMWLLPAPLVLALIASWRGTRAASDWGDAVKSCFDLFLPDLAVKLLLALPTDRAQERAMWSRFSQAVTYCSPESLPARASGQVEARNAGVSALTHGTGTDTPQEEDRPGIADKEADVCPM